MASAAPTCEPPRQVLSAASADTGAGARALAALAVANARYWSSIARLVHRQMRRWETRADAIEDPELRALARAKLRSEGLNARAAAMAATLAPRPHRAHAVEAIVALEVLFDFLDGLTERPHENPLHEGKRLFAPFLAAVDPAAQLSAGAGGYEHELARTARDAIAALPGAAAIGPVANVCARRCAQAQIRMHAATALGTDQLRRWALAAAHGSDHDWRDYLAGAASSVVALHALISAAANPLTTPADARAIDETYLSICVLVTLLDGLVDHEQDRLSGQLSYTSLYGSSQRVAATLARRAGQAARDAARLRDSSHHLMTLASAIAYWGSAPGADAEPARDALARLRIELSPLLAGPLLMMRAWRAGHEARAALFERARDGGESC